MVDWGVACLLAANCGSKVRCADNGAANWAAVLLSVPISYHFHGCTALLVALVVVSDAILNTPFTPLYACGVCGVYVCVYYDVIPDSNIRLADITTPDIPPPGQNIRCLKSG